MMQWKRTAAFLLAVCMLLSLCACGDKPGETDSEGPVAQAPAQDAPKPQEPQQETPALPESPEVQEPADKEEPEEKPEAVPVEPVVSSDVQILGLQKKLCSLYEWGEDALLAKSEYSHVTLWSEDAAKYSELAEKLDQTASMVKRSMEDEYDNLCATAQEAISIIGELPEPYVSTLDIQVRRADSVAISLLSDSWADHEWIEDFRGMHGTNYDTQTGRELMLSDVIKDMEPIPALIEEQLDSHIWAGDYSYENLVTEYFRNTPEDGISWTLDYNGVTFYFADGDLLEAGNGRQTATISFAQHPELFEEKYMAVPDAYAVELPMDHSFFTDLDNDGDLEELNVTGYYNSDVGVYTQYGVYTETDGCYHYEECAADGWINYYVKTADGNHYLYLFAKEYEGAFPMFTLHAIDVTGGSFAAVGTMHAGPGYVPVDTYLVPTDPACFYLEVYEAMAQDMMPFTVGPTGLPEPTEGGSVAFDAEGFIEYSCYDEMLEDTTWWGYIEVNPQSGESRMLSDSEVVLEFLADQSGSMQLDGETVRFSWSCLEDGTACIALENGTNYYLSLYEDGIEDSGMYWMLLGLEERLVWLY